MIVRDCQYGVIGSLEKFFTWYGRLVATYPKTAIVSCILVTIGGGLGLLRYIAVLNEFRKGVVLITVQISQEIHSSI